MTAARKPGLSVVIPAYRASESITRAVESARKATADQIIVVDDGSDDETASCAEAAGAVCVRQDNRGAAHARAAGAELVQTPYLVFLDADDELIPDAVRRSVDLLERDDGLAVAAGTVVGLRAGGVQKRFPIRYSPVTTASLLIRGHGPWPPAAAVVRKAAYDEARSIQPCPLAPRFAEDYELLIRLSMVGGVTVRDDPACYYSLSGGKSVNSARAAIDAKERIRQYYADHLEVDIDILSPRRRSMAADARVARARWAEGARGQAVVAIARYVAADPAHALNKLRMRPWTRN